MIGGGYLWEIRVRKMKGQYYWEKRVQTQKINKQKRTRKIK